MQPRQLLVGLFHAFSWVLCFWPCAKSSFSCFLFHAQPTDASTSTALEPTEVRVKLNEHLHSVLWRFRLALRAIRLAVTFTPLLILYPLACLHKRSMRIWWLCVYVAAEMSGPTVIKLFQWAATRRDLFSSEFCDLFSHLHRRTRVRRPWIATEKLLTDIFGEKWRQCFLRFEAEPIGAGCIAQVFKAEVNPAEFEVFTGTKLPDHFHKQAYIPVALKVAHPKVVEEITMDMELMGICARLAETLLPPLRYLDPVKCLSDFQNIMQKQVDLRHEGYALQRFSCNFSGEHGHIRFPVPLHVSKNILVETFEEGIPIGHFIRSHNDVGEDVRLSPETRKLNRSLAHYGVTAICKMIFEDNFIHGDLHPGNILVQNCQTHRIDTEGNLCLSAREKVARTKKRVHTAGTTLQRLMRSLFRTGMPGMHVAHESVPVTGVGDTDEHTIWSLFRFALGSEPDARAAMPTLVMLDTGITVELSKRDLTNFRAVFIAAVKGDGRHIGELLLNQAPDKKQWCTDREAFKRDISYILESSSEDGKLCLRKLDASKVLGDLLAVVSRHKVCLEPNFTSVILAVMVFEGLGRSLDPDIDILHSARPFLFSAAFG